MCLTACRGDENTYDEGENIISNNQTLENENVDNIASVEWKFGKKVAFLTTEDGWVYTFSYTFMKEDLGDIGLIPYNFYGVNLRYRYNDEYMTSVYLTEDGERVEKLEPQTIQILGMSNSEKIKNDMNEIASILKYSGGEVNNEELLNLTEDDLSFEEFKEDIFLTLLKEALNSEPVEEGDYAYIPSYALLTEPQYLDNYKFQIGFTNSMGCIKTIFIDVLYRTGSGYDEYKQLSDMVDSGEATEMQMELYEFIKSVEQGIIKNNDFCYREGTSIKIADVDLLRLYLFLENIHNNEYNKYIVE